MRKNIEYFNEEHKLHEALAKTEVEETEPTPATKTNLLIG